MSSSTAGRLLVATPQIEEGIFARSVILVLGHDDTGAQGVVLNQPTEAVVDAILPGWGAFASSPGSVFHGGPVAVDTAIGLVRMPGLASSEAVQRLFGATGVVDLDSPPAQTLATATGLRVFVGYAGWSPAQLDGEIATGSWYVVDAESSDAFSDTPELLWRQVLARQSAPLAWMATYPADPALN